jgi:membrane glycosyltransferase
MTISAYAVSFALVLWMMPVILGLLLAIPLAMRSSSVCARPASSLFKTPEETSPPRVLLRANELAGALHQTVSCPFLELRRDADLREAHLNNLAGPRPRNHREVDPHLAIARAKIEDAETFEEAVAFLTQREKFAVLNSASVLARLLDFADPVPHAVVERPPE